jgi:citrate lyase subunit beta/citryl-CoA lyase
MRLRRSELSTPGSSEKMLGKAAASEADLVFCDLEDSVAPEEKPDARAKVVRALTTLDWNPATVAVRINSLDTAWSHRDIVDVVEGAREALDVIIIPKVLAGRDVWWADRLLTQLEEGFGMKKRIGLEVLIEEVDALINVEEIATASPRLEALIFGPGDYAASQGVRADGVGGAGGYPGDIWYYARNKIVVAARAAGIDAIDGPFAAVNDPDGYRRQCDLSEPLGFGGKWAIHPSQIALANEAYSPTTQEVERARRLEKAYGEAESRGLGAVSVDGQMVDAASVRLLRNTLARASLIGM